MREKLAEVLSPYKGERGATIPVLQKVQEELGYLTEEAISEISRFLGVSESEVYGVATFYAQFRFKPQGKYAINVCLGTACHVRGGQFIMEAVERELGIKPGETTPDLQFSLERVACFGSCALAPVVVVGKNVYGRMTPAKAKQIIDSLRKPVAAGSQN